MKLIIWGSKVGLSEEGRQINEGSTMATGTKKNIEAIKVASSFFDGEVELDVFTSDKEVIEFAKKIIKEHNEK